MAPVTGAISGDMVLFITDASGKVVFNFASTAKRSPGDTAFTGMNAYDRDPSGTLIAINSSTGTSGMQPHDPTLSTAAITAATPGFQGQGNPYVQYIRSDGSSCRPRSQHGGHQRRPRL